MTGVNFLCLERPSRWDKSRSVLRMLIVFCSLAVVSAQTNTGEIAGLVLDSSGGVLPGVSVSAVHAASGFELQRVTNDQGHFLLPELPVGEYTLTIELPGFNRLVERGLVIEVGRRLRTEFTLEIGDIVVLTEPHTGEEVRGLKRVVPRGI